MAVTDAMVLVDVDLPRPPIGWCVLELLGHRRELGFLSEEEIAGAKFLRLATPTFNPDGTTLDTTVVFFSTQAVYAITPVDEARVLDEIRPYLECGAGFDDPQGRMYICDRPAGHDGPHSNDLPF